jgi:hypothetical protein
MSYERPSNRLTVLQALEHASFPASRDDLLEHARSSGADETTLEAIGQLPAGPFGGPEEIASMLGPVPPSAAGSGPRGLSLAGDDLEDHPAPVSRPDGHEGRRS